VLLTSGTEGSNSSVVISAGSPSDITPALELGVANGGLETQGQSPVSPSYPTTDVNNILLAYLFTPGSPLLSNTTAITNSDINNNVPGR